jgi:hypothetical protein
MAELREVMAERAALFDEPGEFGRAEPGEAAAASGPRRVVAG